MYPVHIKLASFNKFSKTEFGKVFLGKKLSIGSNQFSSEIDEKDHRTNFPQHVKKGVGMRNRY